MKFEYKSDNKIALKTNNHLDIEYYKSGASEALYIDGHEFTSDEEICKGLFVVIDGEFKDLLDVFSQGGDQFKEIMGKTDSDDACERYHHDKHGD